MRVLTTDGLTCTPEREKQREIDQASSKEELIFYLNHYLEQFRTTLFRQTMFAEFEKLIHERAEEGEVLTAAYLKGLYHQLNKEYYEKKW
ncbi:M3 family metallopeptidase [Microaerobacter geothermalis]|uniref:M3 family metallopeptidase n=1 Tax=Microaerobacter geothermalis TaxID=674972 RepID=UPI0022A70406|nr:M3 family metallopeptidase [Microaerobacter geothermalis]